MRAKTVYLSASTLTALLLLGAAFHARTVRRENEEKLAAARSQREQLAASLRSLEKRTTEADTARTQAQGALEDAQRKAAAAAKANATKAEPTRKIAPYLPAATLREALLHDPKLQNLQLAVVQTKLNATYQPFSQQMKLTEAQAAQFQASLRRRGEQEMDLAAVMETQHLAPNDPAVAKLKQQAADEFRTAQLAVLGEEGLRQFQAYERTVPAREFVNELAGAMTVSGATLNSAQADALIEAMAAASASYRNGGMVSRSDINWDQLLAQAQAAVSPAQFALVKKAVLMTSNMDRLRALAAK